MNFNEQDIQTWIRASATLVEAGGVFTVIAGALFAALRYLRRPFGSAAYAGFRSALGRAILLGLELLVAADIIRTVGVEPSFRTVGVLAIVVIIRTFLSFSLEVEISGRWPWQSEKRASEVVDRARSGDERRIA